MLREFERESNEILTPASVNLDRLLESLDEDKQRLEAERVTFQKSIRSSFQVVKDLFDKLMAHALQVLELRHSEAAVNFVTF